MGGDERALLIYDGACEFCRLWAGHFKTRTGNRVHYATSEEVAGTFPDVPPERFARAVQLIDEDGSRHEGAAAVFRLLAKQPGSGWLLKLHEAPAVAPLAEWLYRLVARHRPFFLKLTHALWGRTIETPRYGLTARLFLQVLAAAYFVGFISLFLELPGLAGERGLLPAQEFLDAVRAEHGAWALWIAPTLAWLGAHAGALQFMALLGAAAALLAFGGLLVVPCLLLMWILYLSLTVAGQSFTATPWDALLLEAGFLAIFLAPFRSAFSSRVRVEASHVVVWLFRFLLFRLLFSSGLSKLLSGETAWRDLTAVAIQFETQPLPSALAWFAHQLPLGALKLVALFALMSELIVPFLFFLPRRARQWAAGTTTVFQAAALLTGNFGFFNLLVLMLCLPLLDDSFFERMFPRAKEPSPDAPRDHALRKRLVAGVAILVVTLGLARLCAPFMRIPLPALLLTALAAPLRVSNDYGTFAAQTAARPEIVIEGSSDGVLWKEYAFRRKPSGVKRLAAWHPPFPARLDWRMQAAAMDGSEAHPWISNMMVRLLQGSRPLLALLESNPFPEAPPAYVRATLYTYRFTTPEERARDGAWWRREMKASYLPIFSLGAPGE